MPGVRKSLLLGALALTALAPPAHGQNGAGLYKPFPEPNSIERSKDFVEDLRTGAGESLKLSEQQLEAGVLVNSRTGALRPAPALDEGATERADAGRGVAPVILGVVALGALGLAAAALARIPPRRNLGTLDAA